ncbi:MAG: M20/M25/M40 family metallo-hydrolase [Ignavibacteriales bacterium]|nr:M20/M25/M40 family metallo-hydrolase [Ignavibacteriales bacterium]
MSTLNASLADLQSLFLRLAPVPGVSLQERLIANAIAALLKPAGITVIEDAAGTTLGGDAGNLICLPPHFDPAQPAMMLTAHLDTVESTAALTPVVHPDRITSGGDTILGGDCRLGLTVLCDLLLQSARGTAPLKNFFVLFTVAEEIGLLGAREFDASQYNISFAYVFDSSRRPGIYIKECVGLHLFDAAFHGKAAHAGVAPEEGINAIALAAAAIANVPFGRIDDDMTANIGAIRGGHATNVVPDLVTVEGEVRSFSPDRIREQMGIIERRMREGMNGVGTLSFSTRVDFEPYVLMDGMSFLTDLERALRTCGLTPNPIRYSGGSDANMYNAKGIKAVNLGTGAQKPHTKEEFFLLEDILAVAKIAYSLVEKS